MNQKKGTGKTMHKKCFKCEAKFPAGSLLPASWAVAEHKDVQFCSPCRVATYFECSDCHKEKLREGDLAEARPNGADLCEMCFYMKYRACVSCSSAHLITAGVVTSSGKFFCKPCSADRYFTCCFCELNREKDLLWKPTPEGLVCQGCQRSYEMESNPPDIADYSFRPRPKFRGTSKNKLFFGFELEVERKNGSYESGDGNGRVAKALREAVKDEKGVPLLYNKHDGSLQNGFEIVSHPFSWYWLLANKERLDPIFGLVKQGFISHDSGRCGMHIHMSKDAFTSMHLYKFMQFFQREKEFILKVSQRGMNASDLNSYARIEYRDRNDGPCNLKKVAKEKGGHPGRYQAVNLSPPKTVEVRIFRGTLKKERFYKNIEFCQALYEFTLIVSLRDVRLENFIGFVHRYRSEFQNLFDFLQERYKFLILKKPGGKEAIRFSGPKVSTQVDVLDGEWDAIKLEEKRKKDKALQEKISESKKAKEASQR